MSVTILHRDRETSVADARVDGDRLLVSPADLAAATGWQLKPEGLCKAHACVPMPRDGSWTDSAGGVDVAAFGRHLGEPVVHDDERAVWHFGEPAATKRERLLSGEAPDFELPDLNGKMHRLSDYRGKKVLLYAWASW
jgi:hypothetical protein